MANHSPDWNDGSVRPTRLGRYEVRFADPEKVTRAAWDGRVWRHDALPPACERSEFYWREIDKEGDHG